MADRPQAAHDRPRMAWDIRNAGERAEVFLYDAIGSWYGVGANDFVKDLRAVGNKPIDLRINSEGGDVFDGIAIYNALRNHTPGVTAYVDGLAASAASFIAMAADRVVIAKNASLMIHEASGMAFGNADDMQSMAQLLEDSSENIASIYAERAGGTTEEWRTAMKAETWYRGQAAVDAGLADEVASVPARNHLPSRASARQPYRHRLAARLLARPTAEVDTTTLTRSLSAEVYEAVTDCVEEWIENGQLTPAEAVSVTGVLSDMLGTLEAGLMKLGLGERLVENDPDEDDDGMEMRRVARIRNKAIAAHSTGKAPKDETWEKPNLSDFTDKGWDELDDAEKRRIAKHGVWEDEDPPATFGDIGGFHHKPSKSGVGDAVWRAISSGRMSQASWSDDAGVRAHLASHYHAFGETPPWERGDTSDSLGPLLEALMPPLADVASYRKPELPIERLLGEHPLAITGGH